jgi:RecB family exonuclease
MAQARSFPVYQAASGARRLDAALTFLRQFPAHQPLTIVAASRVAADELARRVAAERGASFGLARYSLTQLAARAAVARLGGRGIAPSTGLGLEAVAARAAFDARGADALVYFGGVSHTPGFSRALAHTLADLRSAGVAPLTLALTGEAGQDLGLLLEKAGEEFVSASTADRALLFAAATDTVSALTDLRAPLLLIDVAVDALVQLATAAAATAPAFDAGTTQRLRSAGGTITSLDEPVTTSLEQLRRFLFSDATPPERGADGSVQFASAPGEGREAVEVARGVLAEAARGVPFDEMAVVVRAPQQYFGLFEHAFARAGIPACFDRGVRRPHPGGRAFLALLSCACERLSARRFAEYLSIGEVPSPRADDDLRRPEDIVPMPADDTFAGLPQTESADEDAPSTPVVAAPRRWERLLVEAAVVGGTPDRWMRRLDGLAAQLARQAVEIRRDDPDAPRAAAIDRDLERLHEVRAFAVPLIAEMAAWPERATWGEWLATFERFVPRVLRTPGHVLRVLADLRPMAAVGPVSIDEVRTVLSERLRLVDADPPARRYGRVLVTSPSQVRGRAFRVVFLPGLAERLFPQKLRQDPLLPDEARARLTPDLPTQTARGEHERLLLHLAVGAATERLYVSYPRLEVSEGRARVPSFYGLDLLRGATGRIPDHEALARAAAEAGDPSLAWPAPRDPDRAIDEQEHDLAVLRALLDLAPTTDVRGRAQYILRLNPALRRSVVERWARGRPQWSTHDGLIRVADRTREALGWHRLTNPARPYSVSGIQRFAACPYQFLLGTIYRLQPAEFPMPLQRLDPLTRGSLVHQIQATFFRTLDAEGRLPITASSLDDALVRLDQTVAQVSAEARDALAPAVARVWTEEVDAIRRDLRGWVPTLVDAEGGWRPTYFELSFGLGLDAAHDPRSRREPVTLDGRFTLRGAVDLVEARPHDGALRITDHKTGRNRHKTQIRIDGGRTLQPVIYALVVEQIAGAPVVESRLSFCTAGGGYAVVPADLGAEGRRSGIEALEIVDRAVEQGQLMAAPASGACAWCDFRAVCGPNVEARVARKMDDRLRDLHELRSRP